VKSLSFFKLFCILAPLYLTGRAHAVSVLATSKSCAGLFLAVQTISQLPIAYPKDWTVVVACSDSDWQYLQCKADAMGTKHAFTNVKGRTTVIRGEMLLNPLIGRSVRLILLHELGHIACQCGNEDTAEHFARTADKIADHLSRATFGRKRSSSHGWFRNRW
jgi:hypothetical protein